MDLRSILSGIGILAFIAAFIVPDYIAGVNKAMRLGKAPYPKEKRARKWKWIGIFLIISLAAFGLFTLLG